MLNSFTGGRECDRQTDRQTDTHTQTHRIDTQKDTQTDTQTAYDKLWRKDAYRMERVKGAKQAQCSSDTTAEDDGEHNDKHM